MSASAALRVAQASLARSLLFTALLFASVPIYSLVVMASCVLAERWRYALVVHWARWVLGRLERICGLSYVVEGGEHLPAGPCVVLIKHQSAWETIAQVCIFPRQSWVLKRELMWVPFLGWGLAVLNPIAINRRGHRTALEQVIDQGRARLKKGFWVMVFPEGTRVASGASARYGLGGAALAKTAGVAVVPVAHNAGRFWARRDLLKRPGTIRVRIGPPIETTALSPAEITAAAQKWIEDNVRELDAMLEQRP